MTNLIKTYRQLIIDDDVFEMITLFANAGNGYYLSDDFSAAIEILNYTENIIATTALLEGVLGTYFGSETLEEDSDDLSNILKIGKNIDNRIRGFWRAFYDLGLGYDFLSEKYTLEFSSGKALGENIKDHPLIAILFLKQYKKMDLSLNNFLINYSKNLEEVNDIIMGITGTGETYLIDRQRYETNLLFNILYKIFVLKIKGGTVGLTNETTKNLGKITELYYELIKNYSINTENIKYNIKLDPDSYHFDINFEITLQEFENLVLNSKTLNQQKRWF